MRVLINDDELHIVGFRFDSGNLNIHKLITKKKDLTINHNIGELQILIPSLKIIIDYINILEYTEDLQTLTNWIS